MCCDKRQIYSTSLVAKTEYTDWTVGANPIDATAMVSGDWIHDNAIQVSCATLETAGHGEIYGIELMDATAQKKDLRVWILNGNPSGSAVTKNNARSWTTADSLLVAGYISIVTADYTDMQPTSPTDSLAIKNLDNSLGLGSQIIDFNTVASSSTIYVAVETRANVTWANTSAIRFRLKMRRK